MNQNNRLMEVLHFDQEDLAYNRQEQLSDRQRNDLLTRRRRTMLVGGFIMFVAVLLATTMIFLGRQNDTALLIIFGIGVTLCNAAVIGVFTRYWFRLSNDINSGKIMVLSGSVERIIKPLNRRIVMYALRLNDVEVSVSKELFKEFQHGDTYRLYRTPYTGILLSAEKERN